MGEARNVTITPTARRMDTRDMYLASTLRPPGVGAYMNSPMVADQAAGAINAAVTRTSSANWLAGKRVRSLVIAFNLVNPTRCRFTVSDFPFVWLVARFSTYCTFVPFLLFRSPIAALASLV